MPEEAKQTIAAAVRALGYNATKLRAIAREPGALARTARELVPQVEAITPVSRRGKPVTYKVIQNVFHYTLHPRGNGHRKAVAALPLLDRIDKRFRTFARTPVAGDSIDKAIGDLIDVVSRIEGFVKAAQRDQALLDDLVAKRRPS